MSKEKACDRMTTTPPPFTIGDIKRAIPEHCFERNTLKSLSYVFKDCVVIGLLYYLSTFIDNPNLPSWAPLILWPMYWFFQGAYMTGLWVIAHECGHRAFSPNEEFGDLVGMILHSCLLVPYHPWRISHAKHHARTNHMTEDEVFVPATRSEMGKFTPYDEMPGVVAFVTRMFYIARMLLFGWPAHLFSHATGRKYDRYCNHFFPSSPLFAPKDRFNVILSDAVLLSVVGTLIYAGQVMGTMWVLKEYFVPYLWVNLWLVLITHLQHTDVNVPHFSANEWTWLRGALCTVDRDYGFLNTVHHHIADTHVAHHLFHRLPHYHAQEATKVVRKLIGNYYHVPKVSPGLKGILEALWSSQTYCRFVENEGDILWYKDR
eukprot:m.94992 g.94992  ORF g.94992 m.94992 type:complete len:375 (-) comp8935_c0_seq1:5435-6559(-)